MKDAFCRRRQLREILDPVDPESLRPAFNRILQSLQRGKALENFAYYQGAYSNSRTLGKCCKLATLRFVRS